MTDSGNTRITKIKQVGKFIYRGTFLKTGNRVLCFYSRQNNAGGWTSVAQNARNQRTILDHAFRAEIEELRKGGVNKDENPR